MTVLVFFRKYFWLYLDIVLSVHDFEPKILINIVHRTDLKKKNPKKIDFFLLKKGKHIVYLKKQKKWYVITPFYSIFNMSSCRKPKIQNDLPKITQIKWICHFFKTKIGQKSLTMLILSFLTTIFYKIEKLKK